MIVDANVLLYAVDARSPQHDAARRWLTDAFNGHERVGLPWPSLIAFARIASHPRATASPLSASDVSAHLSRWLDAEAAWIPQPTTRHNDVLAELVRRYNVVGNLIPDAHLAALAIEHGVAVVSADTDFARFEEITWINPITP